MQNVHSAVFLKPKIVNGRGIVVAGLAGGEIYIFQVTCAGNQHILLQKDVEY